MKRSPASDSNPTGWNRREFLQGATGAAAAAAMPLPARSLELLSLGIEAPFRIACLSDTHLFAKGRTHRYARAALRAVEEINALDPQPDLVLFGGDLAQGGRSEELELGREILSELRPPVRMIPGEHDWYLDMGEAWHDLFGPDHWTFDHKGVRFVGLNSIHQADFWTERGLDAEARMAIAGGLDDVRQNAFEVGTEQRAWLRSVLGDASPGVPIVVLSHAPLYRLHRPWNFWTEDADAVQRILAPFERVTVLHGHTHQVLTHRIGNVSFHGMLATSLASPVPPDGPPGRTPHLEQGGEAPLGIGMVAFRPGRPAQESFSPWTKPPRSTS